MPSESALTAVTKRLPTAAVAPRAGPWDTLKMPDGDEAGEVVGDLQAFAAVTIAVAALPPICGTQVKSFAGHFNHVLGPLLR